MSRPALPRAPWYSPATRRLALVRIGLPTLLICVLATGPGAAAQAESMVPPRAAALVADVTAVLHPPPPTPRAGGGRPDGPVPVRDNAGPRGR